MGSSQIRKAMSTREKVLEDLLTEESTSNLHHIILYNDDVNTFDHVIETLIRVCKHSPEQAEQCTLLIHYTGKCAVKSGTFEFLKPMQEAICDAGIDARIL